MQNLFGSRSLRDSVQEILSQPLPELFSGGPQQQQQVSAPPQPTQAAQPQPAMDDGEEPTPEEQAQYNQIVTRAREYIHGPNTKASVKQDLKPVADEDEAQAIGRVASSLLKGVLSTAKRAGETVFPDAAMEAGRDVVEDLTEVAILAGIAPDSNDLQDRAYFEGLKHYGTGMIAGGNPYQEQAANFIAAGVAQEVDRGEAPAGALSQAGALPELMPGTLEGMK